MQTRSIERRNAEDGLKRKRDVTRWTQGDAIPLKIMRQLIQGNISDIDYKKVLSKKTAVESSTAIILAYLKDIKSQDADNFEIVDMNGVGGDRQMVASLMNAEEVWEILHTTETFYRQMIKPVLEEDNSSICFMFKTDNEMVLKDKKDIRKMLKELLAVQIMEGCNLEFKNRVQVFYKETLEEEMTEMKLPLMKTRYKVKWNKTKDQVFEFMNSKIENYLKNILKNENLEVLHRRAHHDRLLDLEERIQSMTARDFSLFANQIVQRAEKVAPVDAVGNGFQYLQIPMNAQAGAVERTIGEIGGTYSEVFVLVNASDWANTLPVVPTKRIVSYFTFSVTDLAVFKYAMARLTWVIDSPLVVTEFVQLRSMSIVNEVIMRVLKNDNQSLVMGLMGGIHLRQLQRLQTNQPSIEFIKEVASKLCRNETTTWITFLGFSGYINMTFNLLKKTIFNLMNLWLYQSGAQYSTFPKHKKVREIVCGYIGGTKSNWNEEWTIFSDRLGAIEDDSHDDESKVMLKTLLECLVNNVTELSSIVDAMEMKGWSKDNFVLHYCEFTIVHSKWEKRDSVLYKLQEDIFNYYQGKETSIPIPVHLRMFTKYWRASIGQMLSFNRKGEKKQIGMVTREFYGPTNKPKLSLDMNLVKACWTVRPGSKTSQLCVSEDEPAYLCFFCGGYVCNNCSERAVRNHSSDGLDLFGTYDRLSAPFNGMIVQCCAKGNPNCKVESKHHLFPAARA